MTSYCIEPPEDFSVEMSDRQFLLYLNANGISYDVCKKLKGKVENTMLRYIMLLYLNLIENRITAKEFNLSSYESWSLDLNLTSIEKNVLLSLLGIEIMFVTLIV